MHETPEFWHGSVRERRNFSSSSFNKFCSIILFDFGCNHFKYYLSNTIIKVHSMSPQQITSVNLNLPLLNSNHGYVINYSLKRRQFDIAQHSINYSAFNQPIMSPFKFPR